MRGPLDARFAALPGVGMLGAVMLGGTLLGTATLASADSIYLVSGRVIHSESVRIEDGRVHFTQFGGSVSIPLDEVVRIVENDESERLAPPAAVSLSSPGDDRRGGTAVATANESGPPAVGAEMISATSGEVTSPSSEPAYWIERILEVDERIARVQAELDRLPLYDEIDQRLLRFSGQALYFIAERNRWETLMREMKQNRRRLLHGARKAGISPGALRKGLGD